MFSDMVGASSEWSWIPWPNEPKKKARDGFQDHYQGEETQNAAHNGNLSSP
jgi:hypothetical protein